MTNKILRINEDIQRELATLLRNIKDPRIKEQGLISITAVHTSADLGQAKVYLSVYKNPQTVSDSGEPDDIRFSDAEKAKKDFLAGLKSASGYLRYELGKSLSLRHTPELKFIVDESIEHGAKINNLLSNMDIDGGSDCIEDAGTEPGEDDDE